MVKNIENPTVTPESHIQSVKRIDRVRFFEENTGKFNLGFKEKYSGKTDDQNIKLLSFLRRNPEFRKKWEKALMGIEKRKEAEKKTIKESTKNPIKDLRKGIVDASKAPINEKKESSGFLGRLVNRGKKENLPSKATNVYVKDASIYNSTEPGGTQAALSMPGKPRYLHYSDDPEIPTSCGANWGKFPPETILRINGKKYIVEDYGSYVNDKPDRIDRYTTTKVFKRMEKESNQKGAVVDQTLLKNPHVEVLQWGDFAKAEEILKTRRPLQYRHIAMMLKQVREKLA